MKFSIIVPVYNIENYIEECIKSVLSQDYQDYELILVDDGSTDNSGKICDRYAAIDCRIHVIHKKNQGLSAARNDGINNAESDFIIFLDGDDFWCNNMMLSELAEYINFTKSDIVVFEAKKLVEEDGNTYISNKYLNVLVYNNAYYSMEDFIRIHLTKNIRYAWYSWLYVFRKDLFLDNSLYFPDGRKYEDVYLIWRILIKAKKIGVLTKKYYVYRKNRAGAITNTHSLHSARDFLWAIEDNINTLENMDIENDVKKILLNNFSISYFWCCIEATYLNTKVRNQFEQELKERSYIMNYTTVLTYVFLRGLSNIMGFEIMMGILDMRKFLRTSVKTISRIMK